MTNKSQYTVQLIGEYSEKELLSAFQKELGTEKSLVELIAQYLRPDLEFSEILTAEDFMMPLQTLRFPQKNKKEYYWILSETLSAIDKLATEYPLAAAYLASFAIQAEISHGQTISPTAPCAAGIIVNTSGRCPVSLVQKLCRFLLHSGMKYQQHPADFDEGSASVCFLACGVVFHQMMANVCEELWLSGQEAFNHYLFQEPELMSRRPWNKHVEHLEKDSLNMAACAEIYINTFK